MKAFGSGGRVTALFSKNQSRGCIVNAIANPHEVSCNSISGERIEWRAVCDESTQAQVRRGANGSYGFAWPTLRGKTTAGERQAEPVLRGSPGRCWSAATGIVRSGKAAYIQERRDWQSPLTRGMGGDRNQRHGQSAAAPVLPAVPLGGQRGEARRSGRSSALPSRRGAGTSPGSPAARGGSPAAALHQPLH
jgi:hypothetical protein